MIDHHPTRRGVLLGIAGLAASGVVGCTTGPGPGEGPVGTSTAAAPTHVPFPGLSPDLPETASGVPAAYFSYPTNPATYADTPLGDGGPVTVLTPTNGVGTSKESSPWWQNLQDELGIDLNMALVPAVDLSAKQQTMLASGDIPDIAIVNPNNVPIGALQKYFTDLGPYLGGDAVKEYPALAAIPSRAWKTPTINGTLFGVPQPRVAASYTLGVRADILEERGLAAEVSTGQDLLALFEQLTDARSNRWAFGQDPFWLIRIVLEMHGVPNGANAWHEDQGKFTAMYEMDGTKDSLDIVATAWKSGYLHPDSAVPNAAWFPGGVVAAQVGDFIQFPNLLVANPDLRIDLVPLPKWEGGGLAVKQLNAGASGNYAAFKKADDKTITKLLRFADYLAAPIGTREFLTANYGKEGVSYTFDGPDPVLTDSGNSDRFSAQALGYVANGGLSALYTPGHTEFVKQEHEFLSTVMEQTYFNPSIGLYSPTNVGAAGLAANKNIGDVMDDIMFGRTPVSDWDAAVQDWRREAGDKVRSEYEDAFATSR